MSPISLAPSDAVEGSAVPVDMNLRVKEARFAFFDYQGKAPKTTAARLTLVSDAGAEYIQHYSVGSPEKIVPSEDGKTLVAVGDAEYLTKSSNFNILMTNAVSAGFPENRLKPGDIGVLDDLYAYWIGIPEPKRAGLEKAPSPDGTPARVKILSVPAKILSLPGEKPKAGAKAPVVKTGTKPPAAKVVATAPVGEEITDKVVAFVTKAIGAREDGKLTRHQISVQMFRDKEMAKDPDKDAVISAVFTAEAQTALEAAGFKVDGDVVSMTE